MTKKQETIKNKQENAIILYICLLVFSVMLYFCPLFRITVYPTYTDIRYFTSIADNTVLYRLSSTDSFNNLDLTTEALLYTSDLNDSTKYTEETSINYADIINKINEIKEAEQIEKQNGESLIRKLALTNILSEDYAKLIKEIDEFFSDKKASKIYELQKQLKTVGFTQTFALSKMLFNLKGIIQSINLFNFYKSANNSITSTEKNTALIDIATPSNYSNITMESLRYATIINNVFSSSMTDYNEQSDNKLYVDSNSATVKYYTGLYNSIYYPQQMEHNFVLLKIGCCMIPVIYGLLLLEIIFFVFNIIKLSYKVIKHKYNDKDAINTITVEWFFIIPAALATVFWLTFSLTIVYYALLALIGIWILYHFIKNIKIRKQGLRLYKKSYYTISFIISILSFILFLILYSTDFTFNWTNTFIAITKKSKSTMLAEIFFNLLPVIKGLLVWLSLAVFFGSNKERTLESKYILNEHLYDKEERIRLDFFALHPNHICLTPLCFLVLALTTFYVYFSINLQLNYVGIGIISVILLILEVIFLKNRKPINSIEELQQKQPIKALETATK